MATAKRFLSHVQFPELTELPSAPALGQPAFKGGILYIYANLNGFQTWFPLNRPQSSYVHSQGIAALKWTVNHNLGSNQLITAIYDNAHNVLDASVQHLQDGEGDWYTELTLTEPSVGYAVLFGIEDISAPTVNAQTIEASDAMYINNNPVMVNQDIAVALDGLKSEFDNYSSI